MAKLATQYSKVLVYLISQTMNVRNINSSYIKEKGNQNMF